MAGGIAGIGGRDYGQVVGRGGNDIQLLETEDDGSILAGEVWVTLGHILTTKPIGVYPIDSTPLEDNSQVRTHGTEEVGLEAQLAQQIDWAKMGDSIVGKTFAFYLNRGLVTGGTLTREIYAIGKVAVTDGGNTFPGAPGGPALQLMFLKTEVAIVFDSTPLGEENPTATGSKVDPTTVALGTYMIQSDTA